MNAKRMYDSLSSTSFHTSHPFGLLMAVEPATEHDTANLMVCLQTTDGKLYVLSSVNFDIQARHIGRPRTCMCPSCALGLAWKDVDFGLSQYVKSYTGSTRVSVFRRMSNLLKTSRLSAQTDSMFIS